MVGERILECDEKILGELRVLASCPKKADELAPALHPTLVFPHIPLQNGQPVFELPTCQANLLLTAQSILCRTPGAVIMTIFQSFAETLRHRIFTRSPFSLER